MPARSLLYDPELGWIVEGAPGRGFETAHEAAAACISRHYALGFRGSPFKCLYTFKALLMVSEEELRYHALELKNPPLKEPEDDHTA